MGKQHYANKEKRKELGDKSYKIYGTRNAYRRFMEDNALTIEQIDHLMNVFIERMEEAKREYLEKESRRKTESSETSPEGSIEGSDKK